MTKQEVKDDNKMQEGNPQIKGRVRSLQRQAAMRRMLGDVAKATRKLDDLAEQGADLVRDLHLSEVLESVGRHAGSSRRTDRRSGYGLGQQLSGPGAGGTARALDNTY